MKKILITLTGISGSGKTTLLKKLEDEFKYHKVITCTTRDPRVDDNEKHGVDYFFLDKKDFKNQVSEDKFVENEEFDGNYYGTQWNQIDKQDTLPVAILEPNGAQNIRKTLQNHNYEVVRVFIDCPASVAIERITKRDANIPDKLERRLNSIKTKENDWHEKEYDVILPLNSTLKETHDLINNKIIEIQKEHSKKNKNNLKHN